MRLLVSLVCLMGIGANLTVAARNRGMWDIDFNQFYAAGKLVGSGQLYDWNALQAAEREQMDRVIPFGRIPAFAVPLKFLAAFPYPTARMLWLGTGVAALIGFGLLWPLVCPRRWLWIVLCWSQPAALCLALGQDTVLLLLVTAVAMKLLAGRCDFLAGLALSLWADKPHLALAIPVLLIAQRRWRAFWGGLCGGLALLLVSTLIEGPGWIGALLSMARLPDFDRAPMRMPNLRGLLYPVDSLGIEIAVGLCVLAAVYTVSRRVPLGAAFAMALMAGLLIGHHAYMYDCVLLIPAALLPLQMKLKPEILRQSAVLLWSPFPYLLLLTDRWRLGNLPITAYSFCLIVAMVWMVRATSRAAAPDRLAPEFCRPASRFAPEA